MDTLDDENRALIQLYRILLVGACCTLEVKTGELDRIACEKAGEILLELGYIQGFQRFQIRFVELILRGLARRQVVVIQRNLDCLLAQDLQLQPQFMGERGFSR